MRHVSRHELVIVMTSQSALYLFAFDDSLTYHRLSYKVVSLALAFVRLQAAIFIPFVVEHQSSQLAERNAIRLCW